MEPRRRASRHLPQYGIRPGSRFVVRTAVVARWLDGQPDAQ